MTRKLGQVLTKQDEDNLSAKKPWRGVGGGRDDRGNCLLTVETDEVLSVTAGETEVHDGHTLVQFLARRRDY